MPDQLDTGEGEPADRRQQAKQDHEQKTKACPHCGFVFSGLRCPKCAHEILLPDGVAVAPGKLAKLDDRRKVLGPTCKQDIYRELLGYARAKGKKEGWAYYAYQAFLKEPPDRAWRSSSLQSKPLTLEMSNWIKGYNIRRAKSHARYGT